jgi:hypothetical protein
MPENSASCGGFRGAGKKLNVGDKVIDLADLLRALAKASGKSRSYTKGLVHNALGLAAKPGTEAAAYV